MGDKEQYVEGGGCAVHVCRPTHNLGLVRWFQLASLQFVPVNGFEEDVALDVILSSFWVAAQPARSVLGQKLVYRIER